MENRTPRMRFWGSPYATDMGTVFAENLADLLAKVEDGTGDYPRGFIHTSTLPHEGTCYYDQVWARDAGRGCQELARYGFDAEARSVVDFFLSHMNFGDHWGRLIDRAFSVDYELDGNSHILNGIYETWRASGKDGELGLGYLAGCHPVFLWMQKQMDECPVGDLLPCVSELAGNPCGGDPVYPIYPNFGALVSMRSFAEMAKTCGDGEESAFLTGLANRLEKSIREKLLSSGVGTTVPAGVWLNARNADGSAYEMANFGALFLVNHWTRQAPYIQLFDGGKNSVDEDAMKPIHTASYEYLRHEMAKSRYFRRYGFVSNTCWTGAGGRHDDTMCGYGQNYFTQAALLMDDVNTYGKCLEGIARLAYDGDVIEAESFEMNPFILHECFDYARYEEALDHTFGAKADEKRGIMDNPGDEGNLVQACETLKTLAMVTGVYAEGDTLVIAPRLPWHWDGVQAVDLPVPGTGMRVSFTYAHERWKRACTLCVDDAGGFTKIKVRFGPFPQVTSTRSDLSDYQKETAPGAVFYWHKGGREQCIEL